MTDQAGTSQDSLDEEGRMGLMEHLIELRNRIMYVAAGFFLVAIVAYIFSEHIFAYLAEPLKSQMAEIGREKFGADYDPKLISTNPVEIFWNYIKVAIYTGLMVTMPWILFQIWRFVAPGLYANEKKVVWPFLVATPALFWLGASMVYFIMLPLAFSFLLGLQTESIELMPKVSEYVSLLLWLMLSFGICFQLPVLLTLLARAGIVTAKSLWGFWKYALVGIVIIAALLTPPDPVSQMSLAIPIGTLYFGSIYVIWLMEKAAGRDSFKEPEFDYEAFEDELAKEFAEDDLADEANTGEKNKSAS